MKNVITILLAIIISFSIITSISAQDNQNSPLIDQTWVRLGGPPGGVGYDIRSDPNNQDIMFVTDSMAGIHKSTDRGKTWFITNSGIDIRSGASGDLIPVFSATIDPNNSDIIWVGMVDQGGVYYSENSGESWERRSTGFVEPYQLTVRGITVQPGNSDVVFVGAEVGNEIWGGDYVGKVMGVIYKSTDRGLSWQAVWRGDNLVRYVLIDPTDTNIMYASTGIFDRDAANSNQETTELGGVGILKSTDAGKSWFQFNNGLENLYINSIDFHPENPQIILAGSRHANWPHDEGAGLYITYNGGDSWEYLIGSDITAVEFSDEFPNYAYAIGQSEFYRSFDSGKTWEYASNPETGLWGLPRMVSGFAMDIQIDREDPLKFYVNSYQGGNFYSEDGGDTWFTASVGYTGSTFRDITVHPSNPALVYTTGRTGPFISRDGGLNWIPVSPYGQSAEGSAIAVDPLDPYRMLYAELISGCIGESFDSGTTWTNAICHQEEIKELQESGIDGRFVAQGPTSIVFSPSNPLKVYSGFSVASCFESLMSGCDQYSVRSVLKSEDSGTTWTAFDDPVFNGSSVLDIVVHPDNENVVWAAMANSGIAKTENGGKNWVNLSNDIDDKQVTALALDLRNPQILYAGLMDRGVYKSVNGGITWKQISHGMNPNEVIRAIVIDPIRSNVLYAGTGGSGVYVSEDFGEQWSLLNDGLENRSVLDLGISDDGFTLYSVTDGGGAFRLSVHDQEYFNALEPEFIDSTVLSPTQMPVQADQPNQNPTLNKYPVQIDGIGDDWTDQYRIENDPADDGEQGYLDLTNGYAFRTGDSLYFYVESMDPTLPYVHFDIQFKTEDSLYQISWAPGGNGFLGDYSDPNNAFDIGHVSFSEFSLGDGLEGRIDFRDIGIVEEMHMVTINVMAGEGATWRPVDQWTPNVDTPIYLETLDNQNAIQIDGIGDDWIDQDLFYADPEGDVETGFLDLTSGYAFVDNESLYFMVNVTDPSSTFTQIHLNFRTEKNDILTSWDKNLEFGTIYDTSDLNNYIEIGRTKLSHLAFGNVLEGKISFKDLGNLGAITYFRDIYIVVEDENNGNFLEVEFWEPNKEVPYQEPESYLEISTIPTEVFENEIEIAITEETENKSLIDEEYNNRSNLLTVGLVSIVTLALIGGLIFIIKRRK